MVKGPGPRPAGEPVQPSAEPGVPAQRQHPSDPLHGVTLERIVTSLVDDLGWEELGRRVKIRCFQFDPSVSSSLKFLRRTPWARAEVERLYVDRLGRARR